MSATETTGPLKGTLTKTDGNEIVTRGIAATIVLVAGDPVTFDALGFVVKATNAVGNRADGLGMAIEDATGGVSDDDVSIQIAMGNTYVNILAGAAIQPFKLLKVDSASKLIEHAQPANANAIFDETEIDAARDYYGLTFGRYFRHPKEEKTPTDAADNDVIVCRLGTD